MVPALIRLRRGRPPRWSITADIPWLSLHYLALLERKIGALDQAAPLVGWELPDEFATLRPFQLMYFYFGARCTFDLVLTGYSIPSFIDGHHRAGECGICGVSEFGWSFRIDPRR